MTPADRAAAAAALAHLATQQAPTGAPFTLAAAVPVPGRRHGLTWHLDTLAAELAVLVAERALAPRGQRS